MDCNQILDQNQTMASLPLITDSQADQQLDHVHALPYPNINAIIPNLSSSSTDMLSMEFSQLSLELNNQREKMKNFFQFQYLDTVNAITDMHLNQNLLVQGYVLKLLGSIQENEQELLATNEKNLELQNNLVDLDSKLKALQIALGKNAPADQSDAASFCDDNFSKGMTDRNCVICHMNLSSVVIIPCKHLCCCKVCGGYVYSCPVCGIMKEDCIEVSWPFKNIQGTYH